MRMKQQLFETVALAAEQMYRLQSFNNAKTWLCNIYTQILTKKLQLLLLKLEILKYCDAKH